MRRFNTIIESANPPGINQLWIDKKKLRYFAEGKWQLLTGGGGSSEPPEISNHDTWIIDGVDTGKPSRGAKGDNGITPYINSSGNWQIGLIDTGVKAAGIDGQDGLTPYINTDKNWWIGTTNTGIKAEGKDGTNGDDGLTPQLRVTSTAVEYSYDGITWTELIPKSDFVVNNEYINNPDEEDITVVNDKLKFKDKSYSPTDFSGLGRVYLRKNLVGGKNVLTQSMINLPNTVYHIQYDYDLNGQTITIPVNCTLDFQGGTINNGIIEGTYNIIGNPKMNLTKVGFATNNKFNNSIVLDVTNLPIHLYKYNLRNDGITDNSDNLLSILSDPWLLQMGYRFPITLIFPNSRSIASPDVFLFKKLLEIRAGGFKDLTFILEEDIKFDLSNYTFRTQEEIAEQGSINLHAIRFVNGLNLKIIGRPNLMGESITIDFGLDTINGDYWEGVIINGISYANTSLFYGLSVAAESLVVDKLHLTNAGHGLQAITSYADISNCEVDNIQQDNGISVSSGVGEYYHEVGFTKITNCYCHECADLGISIHKNNVVIDSCICDNCGNNNISLGDNFGVNNSANAGGGYSVEFYDKSPTLRRDVDVLFTNCIARNCYNYGFFTDSGGVKFNSCKIENITPTYINKEVTSPEDIYKYRSNLLRIGTAFYSSNTNITSEYNPYPCIASNCTILNVPYEVASIVYAPYVVINNSVCSTITRTTAINNLKYFDKAIFYNSIFDNTYTPYSLYKYYLSGDQSNTYFSGEDGKWLNPDGSNIEADSSGPSINRPAGESIYTGFKYFDTTLGKPFWWNGAAWITYPDSSGSTMATLTFTGAVEATYNGSTPVTVNIPTGGGGTTNYEDLSNKPKIGDVELVGTKTLVQLGIQPAGDYATETYVTEQITAAIGTINTALDNINGEVI